MRWASLCRSKSPNRPSMAAPLQTTRSSSSWLLTLSVLLCAVVTSQAQLVNSYLPPDQSGDTVQPSQQCPTQPEPSTVFVTIRSTSFTTYTSTIQAEFLVVVTSTERTTTTLAQSYADIRVVTGTVTVPLDQIQTSYQDVAVVSTRVLPGVFRQTTSTVYSVRVSTVVQQQVATVQSQFTQPLTQYRTNTVTRQQVVTQTVPQVSIVTSQQLLPANEYTSLSTQLALTTRIFTQPSSPLYRTSVVRSTILNTRYVEAPQQTAVATSYYPFQQLVTTSSVLLRDQLSTLRRTSTRVFERTLSRTFTSTVQIPQTSVYTQIISSQVVQTQTITTTRIQFVTRNVQTTQVAPGRNVLSTVYQTDIRYITLPAREIPYVVTRTNYQVNTIEVVQTQVIPHTVSKVFTERLTCNSGGSGHGGHAGGGYRYSRPQGGFNSGGGAWREGRQYGNLNGKQNYGAVRHGNGWTPIAGPY